MKRFLLLMLLCAAPCLAQSNSSCNNSQNFASANLTSTTQLVTLPTAIPGQAIHICSFTIQVMQTATAVNWGLIAGTGTSCGTGTALVTPAFLGMASVQQSIGQTFGNGGALNLPPGTNLCFNLSGAPTGAVVHVTYSVF